MFKVQQSIDFLKGLASNERSKELRLMDYCISVVKKDYINESFKQQFENLK